jgi:hypothetical protein
MKVFSSRRAEMAAVVLAAVGSTALSACNTGSYERPQARYQTTPGGASCGVARPNNPTPPPSTTPPPPAGGQMSCGKGKCG